MPNTWPRHVKRDEKKRPRLNKITKTMIPTLITTAVFGGNALHLGVNKIEGMWLQVSQPLDANIDLTDGYSSKVKAYSVPAGEQNVMEVQGGKQALKMSKL